MEAVVFGSSGFIGTHLVRRLKREGWSVRGVDVRCPNDTDDAPDTFFHGDLRDPAIVARALHGGADELYQLAADMGGAGYIFTGDNDARIMHSSALINLHTAEACSRAGIAKVFYASSACVYPRGNQQDAASPCCDEQSAYPADPDSEYGWEKLFSERLYGAFARNAGLDVRIARLHNVYGPGNPWHGGREKAPAALCRKVAECSDGDAIDVWGDGAQTRSFLYIDDCIEGMRLLMRPPASGPVNIGSEQMISIGDLVRLIARIAGKTVSLRHVRGPVGVRGRTSANRMIFEATGWQPRVNLEDGIARTFRWVAAQVERERQAPAIAAWTAPV
jgi:GDP-D-mannose 3', 5'-epimerase